MKIFFKLTFFLYVISCHTQLPSIESGVYHWIDHPIKISKDRESRKILEGTSLHFEYLEIHATTQYPGAKPATAHSNDDIEECIIVKEGQMKITIEDRSVIIGAEGVILLMPQQVHSIKNIGDGNLTYFVMRYRSKKKMNLKRGQVAGGSLMLNTDSLVYEPRPDGMKGGKAYFDQSTAMCERFEMHITQLNQKGPSHKPHSHVESEIILVISGKTEMSIDNKIYQASAGDFYFANSQLQHGIKNASDKSCSYFAFKWN